MSDENLLPRNEKKTYNRCVSHIDDELYSFRSYLRWMCVDQSNIITTLLSWCIFMIFAIIVPTISHFYLACPSCDPKLHRIYDGVVQLSLSSIATLSFCCLSMFVRKYGLRRFLFLDKLVSESTSVRCHYTAELNHQQPYDAVVQLSLSSIATLSFLCLTYFSRKYGVRRFLFFDKLVNESDSVRHHYTTQLNRSLNILSVFVVPCFVAECTYKVWWYASGASHIPFLGNAILSDIVACSLELTSWIYRTLVFFLVCVLFRLVCYLQILRLKDFATVFEVDSDVASILVEHLRIRRHLRIISHRYRAFILCALILITLSQLTFLMLTTKPNADVSIFRAGELALCSVTLLAGLMIILRSATKITHKAQAITALSAKWHICATIDSFVTSETELPGTNTSNDAGRFDASSFNSDDDDAGSEEDDVDNTKFLPAYAYSSMSFQKRHALVTYFEKNRAGITLYGSMLDRTWLQLIFGVELSLVLWLLKETITIS